MVNNKVIIVMLRQPRKNPDESRADPFWEFGSFGSTGCHCTNLMNPQKANELSGVRLAFAQGGGEEIRLVYLTPPISSTNQCASRKKSVINVIEARWENGKMPFCFTHAPLLINNQAHTDFPQLRQFIEHTNRNTPVAKFTSRFRARRQPLPPEIAQEIIEIWEQKCAAAPATAFAEKYYDALPYPPPCQDQNRQKTYIRLKETGDYKPTCGGDTDENRNASRRC